MRLPYPIAELNHSLHEFRSPLTELLPDTRLTQVAELITHGLVTSQSPLVTQIARGVSPKDETIWPTCQRAYRFLSNPRFSSRTLYQGLYPVAQRAVTEQKPAYLVMAVDPVNFEKPYTQTLEGVSRVMKDTPPCLGHPKRVTRGYPAITATLVNLKQPATTYANGLKTTYLVGFRIRAQSSSVRTVKLKKASASRAPYFQGRNCALSAMPAWTIRKSLRRSPVSTASL